MSKTISINISEPHHSFILNGQKTVEIRLNKGKFVDIQIGDILEVGLERNQLEVVEKNIYKSFREAIETEGIKNVVPDKDDIDDAVNVYYQFYTKEQEKEFGVVAIKVKKRL